MTNKSTPTLSHLMLRLCSNSTHLNSRLIKSKKVHKDRKAVYVAIRTPEASICARSAPIYIHTDEEECNNRPLSPAAISASRGGRGSKSVYDSEFTT